MTDGFTDPGRAESSAEFTANPDYSPDPVTPIASIASTASPVDDVPAEHGFGWLGGPVGPAGLDDRCGGVHSLEARELDEFGDPAAMVRPYAWTRGRTKANHDLQLETLISATELGQDQTRLLQLEHRSVSALCRYPLSVAEIAAKLSVPLGVARVVLSDMAEQGLISIHRTFADDDVSDVAAHLVLMERVLSGLRRL